MLFVTKFKDGIYVVINSLTMTTIDKYDFSEDYEIMSRWRPEEKAYFYEHFVFSFEELEQELGLKLPH